MIYTLITVIAVFFILGIRTYRSWLEENSNTIKATGTVEVKQIEIAFKIPGRIKKINFREGDKVEKGQILAILDDEELKAKVEEAEANLRRARAYLKDLLEGFRSQEIEIARAELKRAESDLAFARLEFERAEALFNEGIVPVRRRDEAKTLLNQAEARVSEARERLKLLEEGSRKYQIEEARERVREAEAALKWAKKQLDEAVIKSPISGTLIMKNMDEGEVVSPLLPVAVVADIESPWIRVFIPEDEIGGVMIGASADITVDSLPGKVFRGVVAEIGNKAEFTPKFIQTRKERVHLVFSVKILVDNKEGFLKPGMPADVVIYKKQ